MQDFYVYILKCNDGSYYTGHTDDIDARISQHIQGLIKNYYTKNRRPIQVVYVETFGSRDEAFNAERQIKNWSRKKKEALITQDWKKLSLLGKKKFN